jgi:hypothetical protein
LTVNSPLRRHPGLNPEDDKPGKPFPLCIRWMYYDIFSDDPKGLVGRCQDDP